MAELTFKSPGVSVREIDLSQPTKSSPSGVPAGVIGTARRGPAFVPVTMASFQDFVSKFGNTDGEKFGPLALREWFANASAGSYVRVLGVGDGKKKNSDGSITNAGFIAGNQIPQSNGLLGANAAAGATTTNPGVLGRTFFLGAFMSESNGSTLFSAAGLQGNATLTSSYSIPIIRGVLMAPSGVVLALSSVLAANNAPAVNAAAAGAFGTGNNNAGASFGTVNLASGLQEFVILLNGHKKSDVSGNIITASMDPNSPNYFSKILNTDPTKVEEQGHLLYANYDIYPTLAVVTGTGRVGAGATVALGALEDSVFMLSGSGGRNTGAASTSITVGVPNFESFRDRYKTAFSPFVMSQKFGVTNLNLFRFHALDDGDVGSSAFKITIESVQGSTSQTDKYGTFDVLIRKIDDADDKQVVLESFRGLSINPESDRFIAKVIGDMRIYYDFDKSPGSQKLVVEGLYPNVSQFVRVETTPAVADGTIQKTALPVGFRGIQHLVTSGTTTSTAVGILTGTHPTLAAGQGITPDILKAVVQPPIQLRSTLAKGTGAQKILDAALTWGVQYEVRDSLTEPNSNTKFDPSILSFTKYLPTFAATTQKASVVNNEGTPDIGGCVLDADRFNNNLFSLERVQVITGSDNKPDPNNWNSATYSRNGVLTSSLLDKDGVISDKVRFVDMSLDLTHLPSRKFMKFTLPLMGGFDGVNILNSEKSKMTDTAIRREILDTNESGTDSPTVQAYRRALQVFREKSDVEIQILAIPGIRHTAVTNTAIDTVEGRFDAIYVMDIEEKDTYNSFMTSSVNQVISVVYTVNNFTSRGLDTSFAAAYFPDVIINDPATKTNVQCPPSVGVLGAFALNDKISHPWFAPAGFTRGALKTVIESKVKLSQDNLDTLYSADINPLTALPSTPGVIVFGQKTLLAAQSALDRVNVRRLLIDLRRKVRTVANSILFEPNRAETLAKFSAAVNPILSQVQQQQGVERFRVMIDASTTTQADVENNCIRGKIFLQPTKSAEFISLDFVVSNAGNNI